MWICVQYWDSIRLLRFFISRTLYYSQFRGSGILGLFYALQGYILNVYRFRFAPGVQLVDDLCCTVTLSHYACARSWIYTLFIN